MGQAAVQLKLADAPSALLAATSSAPGPRPLYIPPPDRNTLAFPGFEASPSKVNLNNREQEPFHWKGLLLQSFAFDMMQNATRIITAKQGDRHLLLNKPYWS